MWKQQQSKRKPEALELGKTTVYVRKNITQTEEGYEFLENTIAREDWDLYSGLFKPTTEPLRSDVDFALALLGADESFDEADESGAVPNWDARIEKYKKYYESGQWSIDRINLLLERGLINQEEYDYIVGENK